MKFLLLDAVIKQESVSIKTVKTPVGDMILGATNEKLFLAEFLEKGLAEACLSLLIKQRLYNIQLIANPIIDIASSQLFEFLSGHRKYFDVPLLICGTSFQKMVWNHLTQLSYGETQTYTQVAAQICRSQAVRAVGQAVKRNPLLIFVPCHRIVSSDGHKTGYSGGLWRKNYLLACEYSSKNLYCGGVRNS